jgi:hypothetical protein
MACQRFTIATSDFCTVPFDQSLLTMWGTLLVLRAPLHLENAGPMLAFPVRSAISRAIEAPIPYVQAIQLKQKIFLLGFDMPFLGSAGLSIPILAELQGLNFKLIVGAMTARTHWTSTSTKCTLHLREVPLFGGRTLASMASFVCFRAYSTSRKIRCKLTRSSSFARRL